MIPLNYTREYYIPVGTSEWLQNSEFSPSNNIQTTVTHSGAAIMLVLDCSSSLGSLFSTMKNYANDFINRVAGNASSFTVDAPANVKASIPDDNFVVRISWDAVKHSESYSVYRSSSSSSGFTKVAEGITSTTWDDVTPLAGNNYYRVYAAGHGATSPASQTVYANYALDAPQNVTASIQEDDSTVNVAWDAVRHAESYAVYRSNTSTSGFTKVAEGIIATSWNDATPLAGNNYYRVCAVGHGVTSPASQTAALAIGITRTVEGSVVTITDNSVTATQGIVDIVDFSRQEELGWADNQVENLVVNTNMGTVSFEKGEGRNAPAYYPPVVRMYAKNYFKAGGGNMKVAKIVITCDGSYTGNEALYAEADGTLMIVYNEHTSNSGGTQLRIKTIEIYYGD